MASSKVTRYKTPVQIVPVTHPSHPARQLVAQDRGAIGFSELLAANTYLLLVYLSAIAYFLE